LTRCMVQSCLQEGFVDLADVGSCINVSGLGLELVILRAIMDQRACDLISGQAPVGHLGCSHATGNRLVAPVSRGECGLIRQLCGRLPRGAAACSE
jgi:hypothetical protein